MRTLIAAFDDPGTARTAVDRLLHDGFGRESVHVQFSFEEELRDTPNAINGRTGLFASVEYFFAHLFDASPKTPGAANYAEVIRRGGTVIAIDAHTAAQEDVALRVIQSLGGVDVDRRAELWKLADSRLDGRPPGRF